MLPSLNSRLRMTSSVTIMSIAMFPAPKLKFFHAVGRTRIVTLSVERNEVRADCQRIVIASGPDILVRCALFHSVVTDRCILQQ